MSSPALRFVHSCELVKLPGYNLYSVPQHLCWCMVVTLSIVGLALSRSSTRVVGNNGTVWLSVAC